MGGGCGWGAGEGGREQENRNTKDTWAGGKARGKMPSPSLERKKQVLFPAPDSKIEWARPGR